MKGLKYKLIILFIFIGIRSYGQQLPEMPNPPKLVNDFADMLTSKEENELEQKLLLYERKNTTQFAIVTITSLKGNDIRAFATKLGNKWGIGQKDKNNGLLLLISKNDRKTFLATGDGIGIYLSDAAATNLLQHYLVPDFKKGDYFDGIDKLTDAVMGMLDGVFTEEIEKIISQNENYTETFQQSLPPLIIFHIVITILGLGIWITLFIIKSTEREDKEDWVNVRLGKDKRFLILFLTFISSGLITYLSTGDYAAIGIVLSIPSAVPLSYLIAYMYYLIKDFFLIQNFTPKIGLSITQLSPAETLMLLSPGKSKGKKMMQYTLMDLIFQNVIKVETIWRQAHRNDDRYRRYVCVYKGEKFKEYVPKKHEEVFLKNVTFSDDEKLIQLKYFLGDVFNNLKGFKQYKKEYVGFQLAKNGLFTKLGWSLNLFSLSNVGSKLKTDIEHTLNDVEYNLFNWLEKDIKKGEKALKDLKGNILLIESFNADIFKQIDKILKSQSNKSIAYNKHFDDINDTEDLLTISLFNFLVFGIEDSWTLSDFNSGIDFAYASAFNSTTASSYGNSYSGSSYSGGFSGGGGGSFSGGGGGASW